MFVQQFFSILLMIISVSHSVKLPFFVVTFMLCLLIHFLFQCTYIYIYCYLPPSYIHTHHLHHHHQHQTTTTPSQPPGNFPSAPSLWKPEMSAVQRNGLGHKPLRMLKSTTPDDSREPLFELQTLSMNTNQVGFPPYAATIKIFSVAQLQINMKGVSHENT